MTEIRHVLCPVDLSDCSRSALRHAVAVARWYDSALTVMHVARLPPAVFAPGLPPTAIEGNVLDPKQRELLENELVRFAEQERHEAVAVEYLVVEGDPAREIVRHAEAGPTDFLVLGTHGRSGFDRLVLGSVAEKVVRKAPCPVLTVPGDAAAKDPKAVPAAFHHILAAVDFSEASLEALRYAVSLAEEADAHLTLLHVVDMTPETERWIRQHVQLGAPAVRQLVEAARVRLEGSVPKEARVYCHVEERVEHGKPSQQILRVAEEKDAGLIVLGAHGSGMLERMFFGSTAQQIVRAASCPVLTLRGGRGEPASTATPSS